MYKLTNVLLLKEIRGCLNNRNEVLHHLHVWAHNYTGKLHLSCIILFSL